MKKVYCVGVFDLLHMGHVNLLKKAKAQGDYLTVGIVCDKAVRKFKGRNRPIVDETNRLELVRALECVDDVKIIKDFIIHNSEIKNNDVIVIGEDQKHIKNQKSIPEKKLFVLNRTRGISTSDIIERIKDDASYK